MTGAPSNPPRPEPSEGPGRFQRLWPWFLLGLAAAPWVGSLFARWLWPAELLSHFRFQWLVLSGGVGVVLLLARRWRALAVCGALALILAWPMLGVFEPDMRAAKPGPPSVELRVVTANVLTRNPDAAPLRAYLAEVNPDVICLQEVDARWAADLAPLHAEYPHRLVVPRPDNFGMATYSKFPGTFEEVDCDGLPAIRAEVAFGGETLTVLNVHAVPPMRPAHLARRNRQMAEAARLAATADGPVVVCGDLNCAPWSPFFGDLLEAGGLTDPRRGGRSPVSWRTNVPPLALPIDHLLPGGGAWLTGLAAGPDVGSDHRPLFGRVRFYR